MGSDDEILYIAGARSQKMDLGGMSSKTSKDRGRGRARGRLRFRNEADWGWKERRRVRQSKVA